MENSEKQEPKQNPGFLKVRGHHDSDEERKIYCKKLSSAIYMCLTNYGHCEMRCIGQDAVYNAVKAIIYASGSCAPRGIEIMWSAAFDDGNIGDLKEGHVEHVTAITFAIKDFQAVKKEEFVDELK